MMHDLPKPEQILEELADKVAAQIDRSAPVAFESAFREMTRYHRFLLALNASQTPEGKPFNFAEIAGDAWGRPHAEWIRQYARLFERAADRIPDEQRFIRSLAYAPIHLLPSPADQPLSDNIIRGIVDLEQIFMHRLEGWVTKRTTLERREGSAAEPRVALTGSDAKAYADTLPGLVGAWENLLQRAPLLYRWRENEKCSEAEQWTAFQASWPFISQHLFNSAYCVAVTVWNQDYVGAAIFREALVRWPYTLSYRFDSFPELRDRRLLFPDALNLNWPEARDLAAQLNDPFMPALSAKQLFAGIVRGAHDDVLTLIAALLLFWTINDKQPSDIGGLTARALLRRETSDEGAMGREASLGSLLFNVLRTVIAGERFHDDSYGGELDSLLWRLDSMTERRVVPGRVYSPSTINGRHDLLISIVAMLAAGNAGHDHVKQSIANLAETEEILPSGDRSLRNILFEFGRIRDALGTASTQISRGIELLAPNKNASSAITALREIIDYSETAIQAKRLERLAAKPVDAAKLESIRAAVEVALLQEPAEVFFFKMFGSKVAGLMRA